MDLLSTRQAVLCPVRIRSRRRVADRWTSVSRRTNADTRSRQGAGQSAGEHQRPGSSCPNNEGEVRKHLAESWGWISRATSCRLWVERASTQRVSNARFTPSRRPRSTSRRLGAQGVVEIEQARKRTRRPSPQPQWWEGSTTQREALADAKLDKEATRSGQILVRRRCFVRRARLRHCRINPIILTP